MRINFMLRSDERAEGIVERQKLLRSDERAEGIVEPPKLNVTLKVTLKGRKSTFVTGARRALREDAYVAHVA